MVCDVCFNVDNSSELDITNGENSILNCKKCHVSVHQNCYGVEEFSNDWLCDFCTVEDDLSKRKCELCPDRNGAFKITTDSEWVHMVCALYHPNSIILDNQTMSPIDITRIGKRSQCADCYLCRRNILYIRSGACVKCYTAKCRHYMHVTCAQSEGTLKEKDVKGNIDFVLFCENHKVNTCRRISLDSIGKKVRQRKNPKLGEISQAANAQWLMDDNNVINKKTKAVSVISNVVIKEATTSQKQTPATQTLSSNRYASIINVNQSELVDRTLSPIHDINTYQNQLQVKDGASKENTSEAHNDQQKSTNQPRSPFRIAPNNEKKSSSEEVDIHKENTLDAINTQEKPENQTPSPVRRPSTAEHFSPEKHTAHKTGDDISNIYAYYEKALHDIESRNKNASIRRQNALSPVQLPSTSISQIVSNLENSVDTDETYKSKIRVIEKEHKVLRYLNYNLQMNMISKAQYENNVPIDRGSVPNEVVLNLCNAAKDTLNAIPSDSTHDAAFINTILLSVFGRDALIAGEGVKPIQVTKRIRLTEKCKAIKDMFFERIEKEGSDVMARRNQFDNLVRQKISNLNKYK